VVLKSLGPGACGRLGEKVERHRWEREEVGEGGESGGWGEEKGAEVGGWSSVDRLHVGMWGAAGTFCGRVSIPV